MNEASPRSGIKLQAPSHLPLDQIRIDLPNLFKALGEAAVQGKLASATDGGSIPNMVSALFDVFDSVKRQEDPNSIAWRWVFSAFARSLTELIGEYAEGAKLAAGDAKQVDALAKIGLRESELRFSIDVLKNPARLGMLPKLQNATERALQYVGVNQSADRKAIARRLPAYLGYALSEEWRNDRARYQSLVDALEHDPLREHNQLEDDWRAYHRDLVKAFEAPVFEETFGLHEVFVDLPAYWCRHVRQDRDIKTTKVVVDLRSAVIDWLRKPGAEDDAIRMISGGPGSGKSSFAKMIAAEVARGEDEELPYRALFVPLQRIQFKDGATLRTITRSYLMSRANPDFRVDPLDQEGFASPDRRVLLIFDGLDELAKEGATATKITQKFLHAVKDYLNQENGAGSPSLLAIVLGRTIAMEQHKSDLLLDGHQVFELLRLAKNKSADFENEELLARDLREDWWQKYHSAKGLAHKQLPESFDSGEIVEITTEPLLLYMLVKDGAYQSKNGEEYLNSNKIYRSLFGDVLRRRHGQKNPLAMVLEARKVFANHEEAEQACQELLEVIGCAAWYGNGRTASLDRVQALAGVDEESHANRLLNLLIEQDQAGALGRLAVNFYFRKGQPIDGSEGFEFTHKSFGEYLTSRRLSALADHIHTGLSKNAGYYKFDRALSDWCDVTRHQPMTSELYRFLVDEIALRGEKEVRSLQDTLGILFNENLRTGMPVLKAENLRQAESEGLNAEEALLCVICACHVRTGERLVLDSLDDPIFCAKTVNRLFRSSTRHQPRVSINLAHCLNLSGADLSDADLSDADLSGADLRRADLSDANLSHANLSGAYLSRADLSDANLSHAHLSGTYLSCADLSDANLRHADLSGADLSGADLRRADLSDANLSDANLSDANLSHAHLSGTYLSGAHHASAEQVLNSRYWGTAKLDEELRQACEQLEAEQVDRRD